MMTLAVTVFLASLLGSLHCAGMCGAFVAFAVGADPGSRAPKSLLHVAYNLGRLGTYTVLGVIAGVVGAGLDLGGSMVGVQRAAAIGAGGIMVLFGGAMLLRSLGVAVPKLRPPKFMQRVAGKGMGAAMKRTPVVRAAATGLLTTLLPCGWLYAFVVVAAGTANPAEGAMVMAFFWMGTLPVMIAVGAGVQKLAGVLGRHAPVVAALAITIAGIVTVIGRATMGPIGGSMRVIPASATGGNGTELIEHVESLDSGDMPCCHGGD